MRVRSTASRARAAAVAAATGTLLVLLSACALPLDTDRTSDRLDGGELRVGVTDNPPWVDLSVGEPRGTEVELLERFAAEAGASVTWREGSEGVLADALHAGELDVAIGGYTDDTPWTTDAAVSAVYRETTTDGGVTEKHVVLTRMGENRLLVDLETFLRENGAGR
ncbi:transporter substrate-binding domain-containing protein [Microbacterium sp. NPDC091313]